MAHSEGRISRRNVLKNLSIASIGFVVTTTSIADPANASGGATAGGVYLLSAKQRYNERVKAGVKEFIALSTSLEAGSLDATKDFFAKDAVGGWKDASSAGYLLSNAFRRSSTTPPDSLPTVKKWKAFAAELEVLQKALKKKDSKGALASYQKSEALLDAYLESVELPPVIEMRQ
mmetsp:Transcript_20029/g.29277  ORF Transcript_20029/g.29277 Transcript_20029/m.29277 type:complete len:175 (-) Transcript_20029:1830-2354(-)